MQHGESIEHEWRYGPPIGRIALAAVFFVSCTLILGLATLLQSRGLTPARNLPVSKEVATIFLAVLTALSFLKAGLAIWTLSRKDLHHRRIALTRTWILLPRKHWSSSESELELAGLELSRFRILTHEYLRLRNAQGKHDIDSQWFANPAGFVELGRLLDERCARAS